MGLAASACGSTQTSASQVPSPSVAGTPVATASPESTQESLVYDVVENEEWILFDAPASDPDEPQPHDAIFLVRPDGTGLHRLVHEMYGSEVRATWSPDGSQVAYVQTTLDSGPGGGIFVVDADGSDPHRIFECEDWCNATDYLDWAADGMVYLSIDSNVPDPDSPPLTFEIWRIDPSNGEGEAVLTREDQLTVEQPRVSPDGTQVVFSRDRSITGVEGWAIFVTDLAGGPMRQLTEWDLYASYPDWSAKGVISFNTNDLRLRNDQPHHLYTVAPDGTGLQRIETHDPAKPDVEVEAAHARWTQDGAAITYSMLMDDEAYLAFMNADGSGQRLVPGPVWGTFPELRPVEN
jgi:Tol biopolymer transport system component